jgi:Tfp pilus assembly protein PilN
MIPSKKKTDGFGSSFLPKDYLEKKVERRTGLITLSLFCIVMFGVVAAFFVTNRQWSEVKTRQQEINSQYTLEAKKIEQLKMLEAQKQEMMEKADITTALIEKVPRSILMAELINRMPDELTLTELKLVSKRIKEAPAPKASGKATPRSIAGKLPAAPAKPAGKAGEPELPPEKPKPPKMEFTLSLVGLSQTDALVADYQASLQQCPLLSQVDLMYSGEVIVDEVSLRKFRIEAQLKPAADARQIEPLHVPRLAARPGSAVPTDLQAPGDKALGSRGIGSKGSEPARKPGTKHQAPPVATVPEKKE